MAAAIRPGAALASASSSGASIRRVVDEERPTRAGWPRPCRSPLRASGGRAPGRRGRLSRSVASTSIRSASRDRRRRRVRSGRCRRYSRGASHPAPRRRRPRPARSGDRGRSATRSGPTVEDLAGSYSRASNASSKNPARSLTAAARASNRARPPGGRWIGSGTGDRLTPREQVAQADEVEVVVGVHVADHDRPTGRADRGPLERTDRRPARRRAGAPSCPIRRDSRRSASSGCGAAVPQPRTVRRRRTGGASRMRAILGRPRVSATVSA